MRPLGQRGYSRNSKAASHVTASSITLSATSTQHDLMHTQTRKQTAADCSWNTLNYVCYVKKASGFARRTIVFFFSQCKYWQQFLIASRYFHSSFKFRFFVLFSRQLATRIRPSVRETKQKIRVAAVISYTVIWTMPPLFFGMSENWLVVDAAINRTFFFYFLISCSSELAVPTIIMTFQTLYESGFSIALIANNNT